MQDNGHNITPRFRDWRDLALETYLEQTTELHDRVTLLANENESLRSDVRWYREIATAGIHALHRAHLLSTRQRESIASLREALRARTQVRAGSHLTGGARQTRIA